MKIPKRQLKRIIKEEIQNLLKENYGDDLKPGDYLEVVISDDGYETSVSKIDPSEYENERSYAYSFKGLVRIERVAELEEEY